MGLATGPGLVVPKNPDRVALIVNVTPFEVAAALSNYLNGQAFINLQNNPGFPICRIMYTMSPFIMDIERFGQLVQTDLLVQLGSSLQTEVTEVVLREEDDSVFDTTQKLGK